MGELVAPRDADEAAVCLRRAALFFLKRHSDLEASREVRKDAMRKANYLLGLANELDP